tara:strand:+ start:28423 stop:28908 length:486 start_codon:yes stop_codon:yes gene_type:complete
MNIRNATHKDRTKIIRLVTTILKEFGFEYSPDTSELDLQNINQEYFENGGAFLIMEDYSRKLIATGALKRIDKGYFKIRKMYVHKAYRGKGYGKEILISLLKVAQNKGAKSIVLETCNTMVAAQNLYKSFGFLTTDQKPVSPRCDIVMIKEVDNILLKTHS